MQFLSATSSERNCVFKYKVSFSNKFFSTGPAEMEGGDSCLVAKRAQYGISTGTGYLTNYYNKSNKKHFKMLRNIRMPRK